MSKFSRLFSLLHCIILINISFHSLYDIIPKRNVDILNYLKQHMSNSVNGSAYNWVRPSLWSTVFGKLQPANNPGNKAH